MDKPSPGSDDQSWKLADWLRFAEETFSSPSLELGGEKGSVCAVDQAQAESRHGGEVSGPTSRAQSKPGVSGTGVQKGSSTLLDYRLIKAEGFDKNAYLYRRVISGVVIEDYIYERPQSTRKKGNSKGRKQVVNVKDEITLINALIESGNRAKREIRRLVNANIGRWGKERAKFFTITFAENVQDIAAANKVFKDFMLRLNYHVYKRACNQLKYLTVIQFQDRGAIHWHVILFNLPYVPASRLREIWGRGYVKINAIDKVDNVGAYVASYVGNEKDDTHKGNGGRFVDVRYYSQKRYFCSKGLYEPKVIRSYKPLPEIDGEPVFECEFENEHIGRVKYSQYNPNKRKSREGKKQASSINRG